MLAGALPSTATVASECRARVLGKIRIRAWDNLMVTERTFFSDRLRGAPARSLDMLPTRTQQGLLSLIDTKIGSNWFAKNFPEQCRDGNGVAGTDVIALSRNLQALVPDAPWPLLSDPKVSDEVVFDLVEYAYHRVDLPVEGAWHDFMRHFELSFDRNAGKRAFRSEVNQILQRGRVMYELTDLGEVHRLGTPDVQTALRRLVPDSGDGKLDELIEEARERYSSFRSEDRAVGLERLWDAFERLKTIDIPGGDKKASAIALLRNISDESWRAVISDEMSALSKLGNTFTIRHFETRVATLPPGGADYLFGRMGALIVHLLELSNRLKEDADPWS